MIELVAGAAGACRWGLHEGWLSPRFGRPHLKTEPLQLVAGRGHGSSLGLAQSPKKSKLVSAREEEEGEEETKADDEEKGKDEERRLGRWIEMARVQDLIPAPI